MDPPRLLEARGGLPAVVAALLAPNTKLLLGVAAGAGAALGRPKAGSEVAVVTAGLLSNEKPGVIPAGAVATDPNAGRAGISFAAAPPNVNGALGASVSAGLAAVEAPNMKG